MTKRLIAAAIAVIMLAALCVTAVFAAYDKTLLDKGTPTESYTVTPGVEYKEYKVHGGKTTNGVPDDVLYNASFLTFNTDKYLPVVYSCSAGNSGVLSKQYQYATQKDDYNVAAIINGAFFSMDTGKLGNYGILVGIAISDGKITSAHTGYADSVVAFGSDGSMNIVQSKLDYQLYFDGVKVVNGLYYINKHSGENGSWSDKFYYFDTDCGTIADTASTNPGYEIVCEKIDGTDLTVGGTLKAKVVEIKENSYGTKFSDDYYTPSNKFVLFCKSSGSYAKYAEALKVGSTVEIAVDETIAESVEIMRNANSVITNVGWLVMDGEDRTEKVATIGTHSTELTARWTAFGTKPDGSYVFFTSEGGSTGQAALTLKDVAKLMIAEGCNNVIRMDGGGSSAMYVCNTGSGEAGYQQASSRSVGDCILVVERSSMQSTEYKGRLTSAINEAEAILAENDNATLKAEVDAAKAVLADANAVNGDYLKAAMNVRKALGGKAELDEIIQKASLISCTDYSQYALDIIWECYEEALEVRAAEDATLDDFTNACRKLQAALNMTGIATGNLALNAPYTCNVKASPSYADTDGKELTDGIIAPYSSATDSGWVGFGQKPEVIFTIDLGKQTSGIGCFSATSMQLLAWGIAPPSKVTVAVSNDNVKFTEVGEAVLDEKADLTKENLEAKYSLMLDRSVSARYVRFTTEKGKKANCFFTELEVSKIYTPITSYIYITNFNDKIAGGETTVFTEDYAEYKDGAILSSAANMLWTQVNAFKPVEGGFELVSKKTYVPAAEAVAVPEGGFLLVAHVNDIAGDEILKKTTENFNKLAALAVGDVIVLNGISIEEQSTLPGAYISVKSNLVSTDLMFINDDKELQFNGGNITAATLAEQFSGSVTVTKNDKVLGSNELVGTGCVVNAGGEKIVVVLSGDINGDGKHTASDYVLTKRAVLNLVTLEGAFFEAADISGNNKVDAPDYLRLKRHILNIADIFA